jgi:hypothetical protein
VGFLGSTFAIGAEGEITDIWREGKATETRQRGGD